MSFDILAIRAELEALSEEKYKRFASSLIPNVHHLIGVRIPLIRKIAKRIAKEDAVEYLNATDPLYFEEVMLEGLVITHMTSDIETILSYVSKFVPKIDNWSVCDSFCTYFKIVKEHRRRVWTFLMPYWQSTNAYEVRFAIVMMLKYYIDKKYINDLWVIFDRISHDDYYVKMAIAWVISMCFVNYPVETMHYLSDNQLERDTYNKALKKIIESTRVDKKTKQIIRAMKKMNSKAL
ncbi:MAG: DNA alkylation repair protein [Kiritimatiellae bacterium]|nr:DNA alkylation repair protein [Kiritimatiellia bacterium]